MKTATTRNGIILAILASLAAAGGALFVYSGVYDTSATDQHTAPVYWLLEVGMRQSVEEHTKDIVTPPLSDRAIIARGLDLYRTHCLRCHGAPGVAPDSFALGMTPLPANLALTAREWRPAEMYWVVKRGIKMSGMPAWEFRLPDADLWALVAFLTTLPTLTPAQYRAMAPSGESAHQTPSTTAVLGDGKGADGRGNVERGKVALQQYGCVGCHQISGVAGADKPVGPPLTGIASRKYLAGVLANTPENMVRWLRSPQTVMPGNAMPDLGVSERDARDITAYLETRQ